MIQEDEISVCDMCGKQFWFDDGIIYYIDQDPKLLCPKCVKEKEDSDGRSSNV